MPKPPVHEIEFIRIVANHQELVAKLGSLRISAPDLKDYAVHVSGCWLNLARDHLREAKRALAGDCPRAAYSRAYYSAYNASKAVRYFALGAVSLKGDDHKRAGPDLPNDMEDVENWSKIIGELFEHRLRADYDNWEDTDAQQLLGPEEAVQRAEQFLDLAQKYMAEKYGLTL